MDFWMVFSVKMASKSKPFSMKKPSKKQNVFRASQKSFFLRSWSAPGQCPMTVLIFVSSFWGFLAENGCKKGSQKITPFGRFGSRNAPKSHLRRNLDFSSISHRFWTPFSLIFGTFGTHFWLLLCWFAVFAVSQIPSHQYCFAGFLPGVRRSAPCAHNDFWPPF